MIGWLLVALLVLMLALEYFDLFDVLGFLLATLRLIAVLLFGVVSLLVWMIKGVVGQIVRMTKRMFGGAPSS